MSLIFVGYACNNDIYIRNVIFRLQTWPCLDRVCTKTFLLLPLLLMNQAPLLRTTPLQPQRWIHRLLHQIEWRQRGHRGSKTPSVSLSNQSIEHINPVWQEGAWCCCLPLVGYFIASPSMIGKVGIALRVNVRVSLFLPDLTFFHFHQSSKKTVAVTTRRNGKHSGIKPGGRRSSFPKGSPRAKLNLCRTVSTNGPPPSLMSITFSFPSCSRDSVSSEMRQCTQRRKGNLCPLLLPSNRCKTPIPSDALLVQGRRSMECHCRRADGLYFLPIPCTRCQRGGYNRRMVHREHLDENGGGCFPSSRRRWKRHTRYVAWDIDEMPPVHKNCGFHCTNGVKHYS